MSRVIFWIGAVAAALVAVGCVAVVFAVRNAPVGIETEEGFQFVGAGEKPESATPFIASDQVGAHGPSA